CRVTPVQHEDAPIPAHGHIVGIGKAASVIPIVHYTDGFDVFHCYGWRSDRRAHFPPLPNPWRDGVGAGTSLPLRATVSAQGPLVPSPSRGKEKNATCLLQATRSTPPNWRGGLGLRRCRAQRLGQVKCP